MDLRGYRKVVDKVNTVERHIRLHFCVLLLISTLDLIKIFLDDVCMHTTNIFLAKRSKVYQIPLHILSIIARRKMKAMLLAFYTNVLNI